MHAHIAPHLLTPLLPRLFPFEDGPRTIILNITLFIVFPTAGQIVYLYQRKPVLPPANGYQLDTQTGYQSQKCVARFTRSSVRRS